MEYQWIDCYSTDTNRITGTKGRVECTPTQVEATENTLSHHNGMHFTNGIPMESQLFYWYSLYQWYQWTSGMHPYTGRSDRKYSNSP